MWAFTKLKKLNVFVHWLLNCLHHPVNILKIIFIQQSPALRYQHHQRHIYQKKTLAIHRKNVDERNRLWLQRTNSVNFISESSLLRCLYSVFYIITSYILFLFVCLFHFEHNRSRLDTENMICECCINNEIIDWLASNLLMSS